MSKHRIHPLVFLLLILLALPNAARAHFIDAPPERITPLLTGHASGPFILSASQYAADTFTELEVQATTFGGRLPDDATVRIEAISAESEQTYSATLVQHHSAFTTTLPLNGENWLTTIYVESQFGTGQVEVTIIPYRPSPATPPFVRTATFAAPLLIMVAALILFKRGGLTLQN